jgi:hypothetical protein
MQHLLLPVNIQLSKIDFCIAHNAEKRCALEQSRVEQSAPEQNL